MRSLGLCRYKNPLVFKIVYFTSYFNLLTLHAPNRLIKLLEYQLMYMKLILRIKTLYQMPTDFIVHLVRIGGWVGGV